MKLFIYKNLNGLYELIQDDLKGNEFILQTNKEIEPLVEKLRLLIKEKHKVAHYAYDVSHGDVMDYTEGNPKLIDGKKFCGVE